MPEPSSASRVPAALDPAPVAAHDRSLAGAFDAVGSSSSLRRDLLLRLRHDGPSAPEDLAAAVGASRTGVLQQLHALESAGLVSRQAIRHGVGRPRHVYDVTDAAQDLFPTNYDGLAAGLLAAIRGVGGESLVRDVFEERRRLASDRVRERLAERLPADAPLVDRARELAVIQDEQGYLAEVVLGPDVERDTHIAAGDRCCTYRIGSATD